MKYFIPFFILASKLAIATPDVYVDLDSIELKAREATVRIVSSKIEDRLYSVNITINNESFEVSKNLLREIWSPDLQCVRFTRSINLKNPKATPEYQLYIPYLLHSESGEEPPEEQDLLGREFIIYFSSNGVRKEATKKGGCERD